jgi:predicted transposase/invertase (TIGR01784 family)
LNFLAFGGLKEEREMSQLVDNDPLVMSAVAELQHFVADPDMQELERRRKLWRLEYYSGLEAAKTEGKSERNIEIARSMKEDGVSSNVIAKYTGLSAAEIERLDSAPVQREVAKTKTRSRKPA